MLGSIIILSLNLVPNFSSLIIEEITTIYSNEPNFDNTIGMFANLVIDIHTLYPENSINIFQEFGENQLLKDALSYSAKTIIEDRFLLPEEKYLTEKIIDSPIQTVIEEIIIFSQKDIPLFLCKHKSDKTKEDCLNEGYEKLEDGIENFGMGIIELGVSAFQFLLKKDPVGGAIGLGYGLKSLKDGVDDFCDAHDAFEQARELENEDDVENDE